MQNQFIPWPFSRHAISHPAKLPPRASHACLVHSGVPALQLSSPNHSLPRFVSRHAIRLPAELRRRPPQRTPCSLRFPCAAALLARPVPSGTGFPSRYCASSQAPTPCPETHAVLVHSSLHRIAFTIEKAVRYPRPLSDPSPGHPISLSGRARTLSFPMDTLLTHAHLQCSAPHQTNRFPDPAPAVPLWAQPSSDPVPLNAHPVFHVHPRAFLFAQPTPERSPAPLTRLDSLGLC